MWRIWMFAGKARKERAWQFADWFVDRYCDGVAMGEFYALLARDYNRRTR